MTVIMGPNNSGKTTLLEAMAVLDAGAWAVPWILRHRGWLGAHSIAAIATSDVRGQCKQGDKDRQLHLRLRPKESTTLEMVEAAAADEIPRPHTWLRVEHDSPTDHLRGSICVGVGCETTEFWTGGAPLTRALSVIEPKTLEANDLGNAMMAIERGGTGAIARFLELLRSWDPRLRDVRVQNLNGAWLPTLLGDDFSLPLAHVGDGMKRVFVTAATLSTADDLVLVEEPESFQHPGVHSSLAQLLWATVERGVQVVVTTHSLDFFLELRKHVASLPLAEQQRRFGLLTTGLTNGNLDVKAHPGGSGPYIQQQIKDLLARCGTDPVTTSAGGPDTGGHRLL